MSNPRQDFLSDSNGDFPLEDSIVNGVFLPTPYGLSDGQHIVDNILFNKNALKQYATFGFGLILYYNSEYDADNVYSNLLLQMQSDGYKLGNNTLSPNPNGGFFIDTNMIIANY